MTLRVPLIRWWSEWVGGFDGRPTMWVTPLFAWRGWRVDLHKFVRGDDPGCFHTHPAWAFRLVLHGGYVEELESGENRWWFTGSFGIVRPSLSHRIERTCFAKPCYTLWIRGPKVARIELRGPGWPAELRPVMGAVVVPPTERNAS